MLNAVLYMVSLLRLANKHCDTAIYWAFYVVQLHVYKEPPTSV